VQVSVLQSRVRKMGSMNHLILVKNRRSRVMIQVPVSGVEAQSLNTGFTHTAKISTDFGYRRFRGNFHEHTPCATLDMGSSLVDVPIM